MHGVHEAVSSSLTSPTVSAEASAKAGQNKPCTVLVQGYFDNEIYIFKSSTALVSTTSEVADGAIIGLECLPPTGSLIFRLTRALFFAPTVRNKVRMAWAVCP